MRILQVSTFDHAGGAERIAYNQHRAYRERGHESYLAVGFKRGTDPDVIEIPRTAPNRWMRFWLSAERAGMMGIRLAALGQPRTWFDRQVGRENFNFPATARLLALPPQQPDIVHVHNLHGGYFDLRYLPKLSAKLPVVLTLHDAWLLSGHCNHSLGCERWRGGCGQCPDLNIPIAVRRDVTSHNWRRKRNIFQASRLFVCTASQWLMNKVEMSMLMPAVIERRVIPNGVDLKVFSPGDKLEARRQLQLPEYSQIVLFVGRATKHSPWKDYATMERAIELAASEAKGKLVFVCLGEAGESQLLGSAHIRFDGFQSDLASVARYYQAADLYIHAAHADTFPGTVLEAMACGVPVVATATGGIPEQVLDGDTGILVPPGDAEKMAAAITQILNDKLQQENMSAAAIERARRSFDQENQFDAILTWYRDILLHKPLAIERAS